MQIGIPVMSVERCLDLAVSYIQLHRSLGSTATDPTDTGDKIRHTRNRAEKHSSITRTPYSLQSSELRPTSSW